MNLEERIAATDFAAFKRMGLWLVIALAALGVVYLLAPQMVKVSLYKLSLLPAATWVLYWIDRALNERRPHEYFNAAKQLREEATAIRKTTPEGWEIDYHDKLRGAIENEKQGHDRQLRRVILISFGMIAVAIGA